MRAYADFIAGFGAALRGGPLPAGLTARDPKEVRQRFAVYRNNVAVSLTEALAVRFPVIRRLVGEAYFTALARHYAAVDGPKSPVLAEWGAGFAEFLAGFAPLSGYPYMADVARLEHARGRAFHAADATPADPRKLAAADPERVRLWLHPSVSVLCFGHPVVSIWARHKPGGEDVPVAAGPQTALVLRDAALRVPVLALDPGDATLVQAILRGDTLSLAARMAQNREPGHDPQPVLVALMRTGAIIDATE